MNKLILAGASLCFSLCLPLAPAQGVVRAAVRVNAPQAGNIAYLGVFLTDVPDARVAELKLGGSGGALVTQIVQDSPADRAGFQAGDVILKWGGQAIRNASQIHNLLVEAKPGQTVNVGVSRDGHAVELTAALDARTAGATSPLAASKTEADLYREQADKLEAEAAQLLEKGNQTGDKKLLAQAEQQKQFAADFRRMSVQQEAEVARLKKEGAYRDFRDLTSPARGPWRLGLRVAPLGEQLARYFQAPASGGVLVTEVEPGSAAARAGVKAGDCLLEAAGEKVNAETDLNRIFGPNGAARTGAGAGQGETIPLKIVRGRQQQQLRLEAPRRS
ncbi:MAG: PDZ domain-containing protein [Blastocatellia bacterium]